MNRARVTLVVDVEDLPVLMALHIGSSTVRVEPVTNDYERFAAIADALNVSKAAAVCQICDRVSASSPCAICGRVDQAIIERYYQP